MIEPLRIADHISDYTPLELERFVSSSYLASGALCPTAFGVSSEAIAENIRLAVEYVENEREGQMEGIFMEDIFKDARPCSKCKTPTVIVDIFPKGLCPKCYREKMDKVPLCELVKPDFASTIRKGRKK